MESCARAKRIDGSAAVMRVSSVITPFLIGTLKSTRMNTRRSSSGRSRIEYLVMGVAAYSEAATFFSRSTQRFE